MVHAGGVGKATAFSIFSTDNTWIIDSAASDHLIHDSTHLQSLSPSPQTAVSTADGRMCPVVGKGNVTLSNTITLNSVLVVPSLKYNLLSVGQITSTLNCTVTFWPSYCVFQDILTRKTLGYGVKRGSLYYLDLNEQGTQLIGQACQTVVAVTNNDKLRFGCGTGD